MGGVARLFLLGHRLLRRHRRQQWTLRRIGWLPLIAGLLIGRLLLVALALVRSVAEQELDEAAAHAGTLGVSRSHRNRRGLIGIDHGGFGDGGGLDRLRLMKSEAGDAREERKRYSFEHRRTLYCFVLLKLFVETVPGKRPLQAPLHATN